MAVMFSNSYSPSVGKNVGFEMKKGLHYYISQSFKMAVTSSLLVYISFDSLSFYYRCSIKTWMS